MKKSRIFVACLIAVLLSLTSDDWVLSEASVVDTYEMHDRISADVKHDFTKHDLDILSAAMELENGSNSDLCLLYTGSVILNRRNKNWADSIEGVIFQGYYDDGYAQQYASHTVENLYTVRVSDRCRRLAVQLLLEGSIDTEVVYQSQYKNLGKNAFCIGKEWFAYD